MTRYLTRRLLEILPTVFLLSVIIFVLMRLIPGDPLEALSGEETDRLAPEQRAALERQFGLDRPLPVQYVRWLRGLLTGDWGRSLLGRQPVADLVRARLSVTLQLGLLAWSLAMLMAIPIGILSALKRNSWLDVGITSGALAGIATPNFVLGLLLIVVFGVYFGVLPTTGYVSPAKNPIDGLRHLILPAFTLATGLMASLVRQTRSAMLEVMREDYVRTARAKGLRERRVILGHAVKNALLPIVTIAGLQLGNIVAGAIIVETLFAFPGVGRLTIEAVRVKDYQTVQVLVVVFAVTTILANLAADIVYTVFDPRIRLR
ncbi:MAG: ABC transporter permease [Dehalococcoidia bacterium]